MPFDVTTIRREFPILNELVRGMPLVYLDSAATALKPQQVIDATSRHYMAESANIHRGVHFLSEKATVAYEQVRDKVGRFLGAAHPSEIIFTAGSTAAINLVAQGVTESLQSGDEVVLSGLEHHANIVPWQMACAKAGASIKVIPLDHRGDLILDTLDEIITPRTRILAVTQMSNAIGTIPDIKILIRKAKQVGALTLIDGAQAIAHMAVDVSQLDCDFYVFSAHKLFGPTGVGALYGRKAVLETLRPSYGGGGMIREVTFARTSYADLPARLEPGTPNIAGVAGLGAALDFMVQAAPHQAYAHEHELAAAARDGLKAIPGITVIGTAKNQGPIVSFTVEGVHPHDIGSLIDQDGIAVRVGHHCAQPLMRHFAIPATTRASFALYNTMAEVEALVQSVRRAQKLFT